MTQPLKRTFHGCLTCRRRKVRCLGGDPCLNCSRMSVDCHSSFDANFRIRVSTSKVQKDLEQKMPSQKRRGVQNTAPAVSVSNMLEGRSGFFVVDTLQPNGYGAAPFDASLSIIQAPTAPSTSVAGQGPDIDFAQFPQTWDFISSPSSSPLHLDTSASYSHACFDSSFMGPPDFSQFDPAFHWDPASLLHGQAQQGMGTEGWGHGVGTARRADVG